MKKVVITKETQEMISDMLMYEDFEKKAKKAIIKDKIAELVAGGMDKEIAKVWAKVSYEYGV